MRIANIETPTFAGAAGDNGSPEFKERLAIYDRDGNTLGYIEKAVDGSLSITFDDAASVKFGAVTLDVSEVPELPAEADADDVIEALIALGLVTQAEAEE